MCDDGFGGGGDFDGGDGGGFDAGIDVGDGGDLAEIDVSGTDVDDSAELIDMDEVVVDDIEVDDIELDDVDVGDVEVDETDVGDVEVDDIELTEDDVQEVYSGLEEYDFDGIDITEDSAQIDENLDDFQNENWSDMAIDDQKDAIRNLADSVQDEIGLSNSPQIDFYSDADTGSCGVYDPDSNTLAINENMLYDSRETAATVAHELWHAHQNECAADPHSTKDLQYEIGMRPDVYISSSDDYDAYRNQLVEAEAFAFEDQITSVFDEKGMSR